MPDELARQRDGPPGVGGTGGLTGNEGGWWVVFVKIMSEMEKIVVAGMENKRLFCKMKTLPFRGKADQTF